MGAIPASVEIRFQNTQKNGGKRVSEQPFPLIAADTQVLKWRATMLPACYRFPESKKFWYENTCRKLIDSKFSVEYQIERKRRRRYKLMNLENKEDMSK